jgi:thiamine transporter ThiT
MSSSVRMSSRAALLIALSGPLAVAAILIPLRTHAQTSSLALVMVVAVVVSLVPGHRAGAILAGLSAGIWFDFFLTRPYESFSIRRSSDVQTTVLLTVVAIAVGEIAARRRSARRQSEVATQEMLAVYVISEMLAAGTNPNAVVDTVAEQLDELLFLTNAHFERSTDPTPGPSINRAGDLEYGQLEWRLERDGLPNRDVVLPVEHHGRQLGLYVLRGPKIGVPLSQDRRLAAVALSDLAGAALGAHSPEPI